MLISILQKHYAKGSPDRKALENALHEAGRKTLEVPTVINGKEVRFSCSFDLDSALITEKSGFRKVVPVPLVEKV